MAATIFDDRICTLGEGPLWHPQREQLFWFDITRHRLMSRVGGEALEWDFGECVSAAGWVDHDRLVVASETCLSLFDVETGESEFLAALEADNPATRSNDGRADPQGGFWIGTMGKATEPGAGSIYRFYRGEIRKLFSDIRIPNAICFSPEGDLAYFADSPTRKVFRQRLGTEGWPEGEPELFLDLRERDLVPDGAVVDLSGRFWNAHWGSGLVCAYSPEGELLATHDTGSPLVTCPAFGGAGSNILFCTSATEELSAEEIASNPNAGRVVQLPVDAAGQAEHRVVL